MRRLRETDLPVFQAYRSDPDISRYQSWEHMSGEEALAFLSAMSRVPTVLRAGRWTQIAVAGRESDVLIGDIGLHMSKVETEVEIGISLARDHQGKGLATEAMMLAVDHVFETPSVARILCGADRRNTPSLAMIRRLGFDWSHEETVQCDDGMAPSVDDMFILHRL